jgi:hypothetical protein
MAAGQTINRRAAELRISPRERPKHDHGRGNQEENQDIPPIKVSAGEKSTNPEQNKNEQGFQCQVLNTEPNLLFLLMGLIHQLFQKFLSPAPFVLSTFYQGPGPPLT